MTAGLTAPPALDALARDVMRLRTRQQSVRITPSLALRALWEYILAKFDYIASGVAVNPVHIHPLAIQVRALYRQTLGLPCWTSRALMALPMAGGGRGSPNLELRAAAHLLATYTQASCSRSPMARAAAAYLASTDCPGGERPHLCRAAAALNVQLAVLPDPQTTELAVHIHGDLHSLQGHSRLIMSIDGALRGRSAGGGVVLATATGTPVAQASFGLRVWASPTDVAWLARLVAIHLLRGWSGALLCSTDAATALFRFHTASHPPLHRP